MQHLPDGIEKQYRSSANLSARIRIHQLYSINPTNWHEWVFNQLQLPRNARILEIGCGNGLLWSRNLSRMNEGWQVTLTDLSEGMLDEARQALGVNRSFTFQKADAQELPFADHSFDAVIANHMLYHVPDRAKALSEMRRVLNPAGRVFVAANGEKNMQEIAVPEVQSILYPEGLPRNPVFHVEGAKDWFTLETGPGELASFFDTISLVEYPDRLDVTEIDALIDYHRSYVTIDDAQVAALRRHYESRRDKAGVVTIHKSLGLLVARPQAPAH